MAQRATLLELARVFLKLGTVAFGGPAAHIAMMEDEIVRRRAWLSREEFLDLIAATNLIPGPNSTEMAIHVGRRRAGLPGLLVAGACFIAPAVVIVGAIAWAYVRFGGLPQATGFLYGVKPVVIAVMIQAMWRLARTAIKSGASAAVAAAAVIASVLGANELVILLGAGTAMIAIATGRRVFLAAAAASGAAAGQAFGVMPLFLFFLKVGSVLFGSGYVLVVFLRADLVERWHWLTEAQLLDAVAVGQITSGPVFTSATFIGYLLGGTAGAGVATLGIFLPAFVFVALSAPLVPILRSRPAAGAFLDGVVVASLGLMAVVTTRLGRSALPDLPAIAITMVSGALLLRYRLNSAWLVAAGAMIGLFLRRG